VTAADNQQADQAAADHRGTPDIRPGSFRLDPAGSSVSISHKTIWGLVTVRGTFSGLSGTAEILADGSGRGRLEIDAASIDTKHGKRDEHLRSADFLSTESYPEIVAEITTAARQGQQSISAAGSLTVAGRTRPLTLTADLAEEGGDAVVLTADSQFDRTDFGMSWNRLGTIKGIARVHVVARFVRE
jgi:polyisoprenoid-binding protein YceI